MVSTVPAPSHQAEIHRREHDPQQRRGQRYVVDIMKNNLSKGQKIDLALSYRLMKDAFLDTTGQGVNEALSKKKGHISDKELSVSLEHHPARAGKTGVMLTSMTCRSRSSAKANRTRSRSKLGNGVFTDSHLILIEEAKTTYRSRTSTPSSAISPSDAGCGTRNHHPQQLCAQQARCESVILFHRVRRLRSKH